jgi:hypothetical protein
MGSGKKKIPYPHHGASHGLSNLKQVAMPTTLSRPPDLQLKLNIYKKIVTSKPSSETL